MALQGFALLGIALTSDIASWLAASVLLGTGTAMVYPVLLAVIGDVAHPSWRGAAVGIYRLWRDLGYAAGAILAGVLADRFGLAAAVAAIGVLTIASGAQVAIGMPETLTTRSQSAWPRSRVLPASQLPPA